MSFNCLLIQIKINKLISSIVIYVILYISGQKLKSMAAQEMYQKTLDKNCVYLGINLNFNDIKNHLIAKELISREKANQIEGMDGNEKRVNAFIDHLYQSDLRKTFKIFTEILKRRINNFLLMIFIIHTNH